MQLQPPPLLLLQLQQEIKQTSKQISQCEEPEEASRKQHSPSLTQKD